MCEHPLSLLENSDGSQLSHPLHLLHLLHPKNPDHFLRRSYIVRWGLDQIFYHWIFNRVLLTLTAKSKSLWRQSQYIEMVHQPQSQIWPTTDEGEPSKLLPWIQTLTDTLLGGKFKLDTYPRPWRQVPLFPSQPSKRSSPGIWSNKKQIKCGYMKTSWPSLFRDQINTYQIQHQARRSHLLFFQIFSHVIPFSEKYLNHCDVKLLFIWPSHQVHSLLHLHQFCLFHS